MRELRNIVVPTDFSPLADAAAARAASLARLDGAAIHLVHSISPLILSPYGVTVPPLTWRDLLQVAQGRIEQARKAVEANGVKTVTAQVSESADVLEAIADMVKTHRPELVVMGTHGRGGLQHAFLGSVAERVLRGIDRPVLAVKEDAETAAKPISKILLAVDFSPHSDRAVEATVGLAARLSAAVDVVHAFDLPPDFNPYLSEVGVELERRIEAAASEGMERVRQRLEKHGVRVTTHARRGHPDVVIGEVARQIGCQLVAMGTRGRTGLSHVLLGSVVERTLRTAPCSVLCVKTA